MYRLSDYDLKWINTEFGHYKFIYILTSDEIEEIAAIVKTVKAKILVEAKCDGLDFKSEQEFDDIKIANRFVEETKKWITTDIIKNIKTGKFNINKT